MFLWCVRRCIELRVASYGAAPDTKKKESLSSCRELNPDLLGDSEIYLGLSNHYTTRTSARQETVLALECIANMNIISIEASEREEGTTENGRAKMLGI